MNWKMGACQRCQGDLYLELDTERLGVLSEPSYSWVCLQCGHRISIISKPRQTSHNKKLRHLKLSTVNYIGGE